MSDPLSSGLSKSGAFVKDKAYSVASTVQVNRLESWPVREHVLESPVSVSVMATVSTNVFPSSMEGVVSLELYVGVWSLTS